MPERPRYLAASLGLDLSANDLMGRAAWLDLAPLFERPLPLDRAGLLLTREGARLHVPGGGAGLWPAGMVDHRIGRGEEEALVRALRPAPGERVLDGTFGLGHDALVLARRGARVLCVERDPALLFFSAQGLTHHDPVGARRLSYCCADHRELLDRQPEGSFDAVYLDPMFPDVRRRRSPTLELLRRCAVPDPVDAATLRRAWQVARRILVLRLPHDTPPPEVEGLPPAVQIGSRRAAFATWSRG